MFKRPKHILFFILFLFASQAWSSVGTIVLATGQVDIQRADQLIQAKTGSSILEQDKILTHANARAQLRFSDSTVITLGSNTEFGIDSFLNEGSNQAEAKFNIAKGTFKAITGQIGKAAPDKFKVKTRTATIGIRGTIFTGRITENRETIATLSGQIFVTEDQTGVTVEVPAGQITSITPGQPPEQPKPLTNEDLQQINEDSEDEGNENADENEGDSQSNQDENDQVLEDEGIDDGDSGASNEDAAGIDNLNVNSDIDQQAGDLQRQNNEQETKDTIEEEYNDETSAEPDPVEPDPVEPDPVEPDPVEPDLTNVDRNQAMTGMALQKSLLDSSVGISVVPLSYALTDNTLSSDATNAVYFVDEAVPEGQTPPSAEMIHNLDLALEEATDTYGGLESVIQINDYAISFNDQAGELLDSDVPLSIYTDDMQEFFYFTAQGDNISYKEVFGVPLAFDQLPTSGVVSYASPDNPTQAPYLVNYANGHIMQFNLADDKVTLFTGQFFDDLIEGSGFDGYSTEYDFDMIKVGLGISDPNNWGVFGSEAQGLAFGLYQPDPVTESFDYDLMVGFKDTSQTYSSDDLLGSLTLKGMANRFSYETGYLDPPVDFELDIDKQSGVTDGFMDDYYNMDTYSLQGSASYINSDNFLIASTLDDVWMVATDNNGISDNEYISWGYWGKPGTDDPQAPIPAVGPNTWVAGEFDEAVNALVPVSGSYTYNGTVMGQVFEASSWSHIDAANNEVQIKFDFSSGYAAIDSASSYINFTADGKDWNLTEISGGTEGGFWASFSGTHDGNPINGGGLEGNFYGDQAQAIGGVFNAESPTATAVGVFQGKRP